MAPRLPVFPAVPPLAFVRPPAVPLVVTGVPVPAPVAVPMPMSLPIILTMALVVIP